MRNYVESGFCHHYDVYVNVMFLRIIILVFDLELYYGWSLYAYVYVWVFSHNRYRCECCYWPHNSMDILQFPCVTSES
jgi:hypothetical protein